ncbi:MAG: enoyl-CoA hydratase/isomerase family protein [Planctomycetaceae bacterium]|nr:enoyl-CoA hydratase/isomerase family protein [Planctomycetaceae bacterium]
MATTTVELITSQPGVARVTFRSENGVQILSRAVLKELRAIVKQLDADPSLRVVVFQAEGRTFLAGADLNELKSLNETSAHKYSRGGQRLFQRIAELPAVTICAIHAACAGGGCELALACDVRLAAAAARIGLPEVTLGLIPGWGGTVRSTLLLGAAVARRVILSGELFDAAEAARLGLVDAVYPNAEFSAAVEERVAQFLKTGPAALGRAKRLIGDIDGIELSDLLEFEAEEFADCFVGGEPAEGLTAFLEKREAVWSQREPS